MVLLVRLCKTCHDFIWEIKWKEERLKCLNYAGLDSVYPIRNYIGRRKLECFLSHQTLCSFELFSKWSVVLLGQLYGTSWSQGPLTLNIPVWIKVCKPNKFINNYIFEVFLHIGIIQKQKCTLKPPKQRGAKTQITPIIARNFNRSCLHR